MKGFRLISALFVPLFVIVSASAQVRVATRDALTTSTIVTPTAGNNFAVFDSAAFTDQQTGIARVVAAIAAVNIAFEPVKKDLEEMQTRYASLISDVEKKQSTAEPTIIRQMREQAENLSSQIKRKSEDAQANYEKQLNSTLDPLQADISKALDAYATAHGILLVIDVSRVPVIYAHNSIDITKDFIAEYNRTHPVATNPAKP